MEDIELIEKAASVIKTKKTKDCLIGDVGCALQTKDGNVYTGVCVDVSSTNTFCAEANAIGSMITKGEYDIIKIVAVWKDENDNNYVIPPCGNCREFIKQINDKNIETQVILDINFSKKLSELIPYFDLWQKV